MRPLLAAVALLALSASLAADTLIVHTGLEYSVYLPDNWVMEAASDSQHNYFDTTGAFASQLSLIRHRRNPADFPTPEDWTRAHFIAYKLVVEHGVDPWGAVLFYDSSATSTQGNLWAPEIYTTLFGVNPQDSWSEYSRFTASGDYGYELYALGDTTDMLTHLATYAAVLRGIDLPGSGGVAVGNRLRPVRVSVQQARGEMLRYLFDARGRRLGLLAGQSRQLPCGAYVTSGRRNVLRLQ